MKKKYLIVLVWLSLFFSLGALSVAADEDNAVGTYGVTPILSKNQTNGVEGFFDIGWLPGEKEIIGVRITNKTSEAQTYHILVTKAETNVNQIIDYTNKEDSDLETIFKLKECVVFPQEVIVPANASKIVEGEISFPAEDFNGILMGGINISQEKAMSSDDGLSNIIVYNIPLVLRGNIEKRPEPVVKFGQLSLDESLVNEIVLNVPIKNMGPNLLNQVNFKATILDNKNEVIETEDLTFDVTPETIFDYQILLKEHYKAGDYQLELQLTHSSGKEWTFNQLFTVSEKEAKEIYSLQNKGDNQVPLYIILVPVGVLLLFGSWLVIKKRR